MNFFNKIKLFYKYYADSSLTIGGRVTLHTDNSLNVIKEPSEMLVFLNTFFVECPRMEIYKESTYNKYYLLTRFWDFMRHIITCISVCKYDPKKSFKYIKMTMKEILNINKSHNYYMNLNKH